MIYKEEVRDLFTVPSDYYLAHCISADFALGAGIAKEFNKRFDMRRRLKVWYPNYFKLHQLDSKIYHACSEKEKHGECLLVGRVCNLVTKQNYYDKPSYDSLECALYRMKKKCQFNGAKKIAMPKIGCGLDKLEWDKVSQIVQEVFKDTDIEILVCIKE